MSISVNRHADQNVLNWFVNILEARIESLRNPIDNCYDSRSDREIDETRLTFFRIEAMRRHYLFSDTRAEVIEYANNKYGKGSISPSKLYLICIKHSRKSNINLDFLLQLLVDCFKPKLYNKIYSDAST